MTVKYAKVHEIAERFRVSVDAVTCGSGKVRFQLTAWSALREPSA
jgi:hypothetical protein